MYTEEEAKNKWCPMAQIAAGAESAKNANLCDASGCMMWRWEDAPMTSKPTGYCGLAGKAA